MVFKSLRHSDSDWLRLRPNLSVSLDINLCLGLRLRLRPWLRIGLSPSLGLGLRLVRGGGQRR